MKTSFFAFVLVTLLAWTQNASAHCEIPCGIYGDQMRIEMLREDLTTVEKSMKSVIAIGADKSPDWNQLVRWITNKEDHATKIQTTVTQYFMAQRIKPSATAKNDSRYIEQLTTMHELLIEAMKMKQSTDVAHVANGRKLVDRFVRAYFSASDQKHLLEHR